MTARITHLGVRAEQIIGRQVEVAAEERQQMGQPALIGEIDLEPQVEGDALRKGQRSSDIGPALALVGLCQAALTATLQAPVDSVV